MILALPLVFALLFAGIGFFIGAAVVYSMANREEDLVYIHKVKGMKCCTHEGVSYQLKRVPESGILDPNIDA